MNIEKYYKIYNKLSDLESKITFENILNFRLSYDLQFMRGYSDLKKKQYFELFLKLGKKKEIFVDIGCFDE